MLMDFYDDDPRQLSWEKVTRKMVDHVTFSCSANIAFVPRIEDCSYETTCFAISQPRFGETPESPSPTNGHKNKSTRDGAKGAKGASSGITLNQPKVKMSGVPSLFASGQSPKNSRGKKSGGDKVSSLGAFFSKTAAPKIMDHDNQSVGSKSLSSRSVSDRSHAERSKAEEKLKSKSNERAGHKRKGSKDSIAMRSIDEMSITDFEKESVDSLGSFLKGGTLKEVDEENMRLQGSLSSFLENGSAGSKKPQKSRGPKKPVVKKLQFREKHEAREMPHLSDAYYDDWDNIWYNEEELADMKYEAFLEEAGLDIDEYMNM